MKKKKYYFVTYKILLRKCDDYIFSIFMVGTCVDLKDDNKISFLMHFIQKVNKYKKGKIDAIWQKVNISVINIFMFYIFRLKVSEPTILTTSRNTNL